MSTLSNVCCRIETQAGAVLLWLALAVFGADPARPSGGARLTNAPFASEYKLTGIVAFESHRKAYLLKHELNNVQRQISLGEGEKFQDLELLAINSREKSIRVRYRGTEGTMTLNSHGVRPIATVADQGKEFVEVHKQFVNDHHRAHEERQRREAKTKPSPSPKK